MYKKAVAISSALLLSACSTMTSNEAAMQNHSKVEQSDILQVNESALQHHHWVLTQIDGKPLTVNEHFNAPTLEVGEKMAANGSAGCNNFFGQSELDGNNFRIEQIGATMKMCPDDVMLTEMLYLKSLAQWNQLTLTANEMQLKNAEHTLTFTLKDWVN
ncbi:META domain-containing protein [Vibrio ezurae]|uniref:Heat shock protein HslJ n=1 Tax=Vibrio ezurae NBRC 102218 TaxID=1219080 RepID=U3B104_9VIBR|nr:META domain-containing protein [Vibrio ezurae]GAD79152.1 heat shock protein HslJ [Vibrio ezurae NBRC 102218]